ncbi:hypothetical protein EIN_062890 [Entamoeba invadens IP1]|uniref:hypothetical protein n=1 Tax=Entamoeba invadens IP1 TaxID=370355 RepID=UPI0002C3F23E|nr:hypothetical protein EIN_062890 [Entamoeba invadens IP1]ELP93584.1 hypothetical protein EIN_062890 [Entamoeba invadens IP1]|eukprot:XP_004260355.1 hypothetical protein EIN_062890 [Entamoeba invadens IP1]
MRSFFHRIEEQKEVRKTTTASIEKVRQYLVTNNYKLLRYLIKTNAVLMLPQPAVLKDFPLSNEFIIFHSIYLNTSTGNFITLNGVYGKIEKSQIKLYPFHEASHERLTQEQLSTRMSSFHDLNVSATSTSKIVDTDILVDRSEILPILNLKSLLYYETCAWMWRRGFTMTFKENNEFSIYREFQQILDTIRRETPSLTKIEKESHTKYFCWDFDKNTKSSMVKQEEDMKNFYMKLLMPESQDLIALIQNFVKGFVQLVEGKEFEKRKIYINECIKLAKERALKIHLWVVDWDENGFVNNMNRLLINKLFKHLWPPTISLSEKISFDSIESDSFCYTLSKSHSRLLPKHFGIDVNENEPGMKEAMKMLLKVDSVCTPIEKIMYMFCSFKILEQLIHYHFRDNVSADLLFPLCLYITLKSALPNIDSTIFFIEQMQMQINSEMMYYYCNFLACKDYILTLCYNSLKDTMSIQEYETVFMEGMNILKWPIPKTLLVPQKMTIQKVTKFVNQSSAVQSEEISIQYYLSLPPDELTSEDLPNVLHLLQDSYAEAT